MHSEGEEMTAIAAHEEVGSRLQRAGENLVIARVSCHGLDYTTRFGLVGGDPVEQIPSFNPALIVESEFQLHHPLELADDGRGDDQLDLAIDR